MHTLSAWPSSCAALDDQIKSLRGLNMLDSFAVLEIGLFYIHDLPRTRNLKIPGRSRTCLLSEEEMGSDNSYGPALFAES
jgi:hypothetical protein